MFQRLTPAVKNLLILNVGIFLIQAVCPVHPVAQQVGGSATYIDYYGMLFDFSNPLFKPWQFLTHGFLHADISHIFSNMLLLFFMGPMLESIIGDKKFLVLYLGSLLFAGAGEVLVNHYIFDHVSYSLLGASGATMGVLAATALLFPDREVHVYFLFPVKLKYVAMFLIAMDALGVIGFSGNSDGPLIAHAAHLGGALFGAALTLYWKSKGKLFG